MELNKNLTKSANIGILALVIAIITQDFSWLIVVFMLALNITFKLVQRDSRMPELKISKKISGKQFRENDQIKITLTIYNTSDYVFRGEIYDELPNDVKLWEGTNILLLTLQPQELQEYTYTISFYTRGKYQLGPIRGRYHSMGEAYHEYFEVPRYKDVIIVPFPDKVSKYTLPASFLTSLGGNFKSKLVGDGMDFSGVREYQVGDTFRRINWKRSAKFHELYSNEFQLNRATNVIIVLNLAEESVEIANSAVRAALGVAIYLSSNRSKVGLITLGEYVHYIPPKGGKRHLMEITELLTNTKSINEIKNLELFKQRFHETMKKANTGNNEILLFSSLNNLSFLTLLADELIKIGKLKVITPSISQVFDSHNKGLSFARKLIIMRRSMISNYLMKRSTKIFEWLPGVPFDVSISQWRER